MSNLSKFELWLIREIWAKFYFILAEMLMSFTAHLFLILNWLSFLKILFELLSPHYMFILLYIGSDQRDVQCCVCIMLDGVEGRW